MSICNLHHTLPLLVPASNWCSAAHQQNACFAKQDGDNLLFYGGDHGTPEAAAEQYNQLALLALPKQLPQHGARDLVRTGSLDSSPSVQVSLAMCCKMCMLCMPDARCTNPSSSSATSMASCM